MDQGIIENLKQNYKKLLVCHRLEAIDEGKVNCFAKAQFIKDEIQTEAQDEELIEVWEALPSEEKMHKKGISSYLTFSVDQRLQTGEQVESEDGDNCREGSGFVRRSPARLENHSEVRVTEKLKA
ncbi:hypothetical protein RF11_11085 [Thelohanellus kitauei]|uniref:Uncharacterized protein n=1 Tax=Thelohanellus kitauei TaxID=669202 RepID=A0A0C2MZ69_THEKT|nr:hypothetical protein RF11_11085 [Thelohanellus kitauei]